MAAPSQTKWQRWQPT